MAKSFVCRNLFGLGITSVADFIRLMNKHKLVQEVGIDYVSAASFTFPKKAGLVVFDSIRELIKFNSYLTKDIVAVVSDTPVILKELPEMIPLDYVNNRSFEFSFKEVDPYIVLRALRTKKSVECDLVSHDNLGYHVNRIRVGGDLINSYISLTGSLPFDARSKVRAALVEYFGDTKPSLKKAIDTINDACKDFNFDEEVNTFLDKFEVAAPNYLTAVKSEELPAVSAKKLGLDQYTIAYFRKLLSQKVVNDERIKKNNAQIKRTKTA